MIWGNSIRLLGEYGPFAKKSYFDVSNKFVLVSFAKTNIYFGLCKRVSTGFYLVYICHMTIRFSMKRFCERARHEDVCVNFLFQF
jgi:hypothetical protein